MLNFCQLPVWSVNLRYLCCQSNGGQRCSFLECSIQMRSPWDFRTGLLLSQGETWSLSRVGVLRPTVCESLICTLLTLSVTREKWPEREETCLINGAILLILLLSQILLFLIRLSKLLLHCAPAQSQDKLNILHSS